MCIPFLPPRQHGHGTGCSIINPNSTVWSACISIVSVMSLKISSLLPLLNVKIDAALCCGSRRRLSVRCWTQIQSRSGGARCCSAKSLLREDGGSEFIVVGGISSVQWERIWMKKRRGGRSFWLLRVGSGTNWAMPVRRKRLWAAIAPADCGGKPVGESREWKYRLWLVKEHNI